MRKFEQTTEELTKAFQGAGMVADDLRAALKGATPLEALVLLPLYERAQLLAHDVQALLQARST